MPRREDIDRFTQVLNSLGDEPAIRAARSESIEEVPPSEPEESESLGLEGEGTEAGSAAEMESLQGIFDGLSALSEEAGVEAGPAPDSTAEPSAPGPADEGLDYASLFGEEAAPEGIEELEKPAPARAAEPEEESFSFPEGEPESLQADLSQLETLPDEQPQGERDIGRLSEASQGAGEAFEDLGSFALETPEPAERRGAETGAAEAPSFETPAGEPSGGESLELPSLDDLSFPEAVESPSESAEPSLEQPMPSLEVPSLDEAASEPSGEAPSEGLGLGTAGTEMDQFPSELAGVAEPGAEPAEAPEAAMESLGEESLEDLNLDQFSLPESAEQFSMPSAPAPRPPVPTAAPARPRPAERKPGPQPRVPTPQPEKAFGEGEIELTPEQFAQLKRVLGSLPRNLKIAVQDLIGERTAMGADLAALLNLLLQGASAQEIATLAGRISGKRIRIPAGYEKKTGAAFEAEQRTFAYAFRENFLPLLRVIVITVLAGALFGFLGYNYVYRPLYAYTNYRSGYAQIANERYTLANERFARATSVWPLKGWYYSYAEAFAAKRQYVLAEKKYDDLLKVYPGDKRGILDYARLESTRLADYEKADTLLKHYLDRHLNDYDALLASGDNYLSWGERFSKGEPERNTTYESARLAYATLIDRYGARDELLFRMLRFFIRTDNATEVERLRAFYATQPDAKIDAPVFAELGGYLVDHRRLDFVQDVLFRADKRQPGLYEVHYDLARYYRIVRNAADEKKALDVTVKLLDLTRNTDPVTRRRLTLEIDTHTRLGEYFYGTQEYIPAERELQTAIRIVENNQKMKLIDRDRIYGRPYAVLGDLYYYIQGDLTNAAVQYQNAVSNLYTDPQLTYKIGYVQYSQKDYKDALISFSGAEDASAYPSGNEEMAPVAEPSEPAPPTPAGQPPQNLLYALGNTFYQRGDFFAAQGYFLRLFDRLQNRRAVLGILHPEDRSDDRALLESLARVNNNLGVTMFRLAHRTGDRNKKSEALVYLSAATEIAVTLASSPDTVKRSEDRNLPSLNMRGILYPLTGFVPQIFTAIPKDFEAATW